MNGNGWRVIGPAGVACVAMLWAALSGGSAVGQNQGAGVSAAVGIDCTDTAINYEHDPMLSDAENLAAMERAFYDSLAKFDYCTTQQAATGGGGSSGGGSGGGDPGDAAGLRGTDAPVEASGANVPVATAGVVESAPSDLQGTEPVEAVEPASQGELAGAGAVVDTGDDVGRTAKNILNNGAVPKDIPPADNDNVLEKQIRQAAMEEQDPEKRWHLWNEYRKFKGLPLRDDTAEQLQPTLPEPE